MNIRIRLHSSEIVSHINNKQIDGIDNKMSGIVEWFSF